jgi:cytoskeletal protein CcmA (bactofilin family)
VAYTRTGETVVVGAGEIVDGNLTVAAANVTVHGRVRGDLVALGGTVVIDGPVEGDVFIAAGQATVTGVVDGDLRAAVGSLGVDGPVGGDVLATGGLAALSSSVGGDVLAAVGTAKLGGSIAGSLDVNAGDVALEGQVYGPVTAVGDHLTLGAQADVAGDVAWTGRPAVDRDPRAQIAGRLVVHPVPPAPLWPAWIFGALQMFVGLYALGRLWFAGFGRFVDRASGDAADHGVACAGTGLAVLVGGPVIALVITVVGAIVGGAWLGPLALAVFAIAVALAFPLVAGVLARRLTRGEVTRVGRWVPPALVLAGLVLAAQLPFVGPVIAVVVAAVGVGAIARALPTTLRSTRTPPAIPGMPVVAAAGSPTAEPAPTAKAAQ